MNNINSKGQMGNIVSIILIIAGAIILYLFISRVGEKTSYEQSINACRLSVIAQSSTEVAPTFSGLKSPFDINCDKRYVTFYNTRVEIGLSPENMKSVVVKYGGRSVKKFSTLSDSIVDQTIAEEMRICKYQFAEGKIEIFENNDKIYENQNVCFICSEIMFEKDNIETETFKTFLEYTKKTRFGTSDQTYYNYLTEDTFEGKGVEVTDPIMQNYNMWNQPHYQDILKKWESVAEDNSYTTSPIYLNFKSYSNLDFNKNNRYFVIIKKSTPALLNPFVWDNSLSLAVIDAEKVDTYCDIQAS